MEGGVEKCAALACLRNAIEVEKSYLAAYEKPCEPIVFETLRTMDDLFCRELMEPWREVTLEERIFRNISTWGVNQAPRRVIPKSPQGGPFRDFPSKDTIQNQADDFMVHCGVLAIAERLEGWLEDGLMLGEVRRSPKPGLESIVILRNGAESTYDEEIRRAGVGWACNFIWQEGLPLERSLEVRHREIEPQLQQHVVLRRGWQISYTSTREIDDYFLEWGKHYLRRIFSQDMIGLDDVIGGRPFSRYLDVLSALSARSQKHIAFAAILRARHPSVHIRNLLTTYCPRKDFIELLASYMGADRIEIEAILNSFILTGSNLETHTRGGDVTWAPIVQASSDMLILPTYGIDINPFLFLLTDLKARYETDWFNVANNRERRWIRELEALFLQPRWQTRSRTLKLRDAGRVMTDIDFSVYDTVSNALGLFQLKWQQPIGMDNRGRRSAGKNLGHECNRWVGTMISWLEKHGISELVQRLGFTCPNQPKLRLFVLARYQAHFSGYGERDGRAVWSDWAHFRRVCIEGANGLSVEQIASQLASRIDDIRSKKHGESMMFPVGNIAIALNPTSVPEKA